MSTLDAEFYFAEHDNVPMHIGSVAVFDGPAPAYQDVVRLIEAKLPSVPRYRQVVRTTPGQIRSLPPHLGSLARPAGPGPPARRVTGAA